MIAFISDIHGNYPALKAALDEIDKRECDTIISLGDVVGYYSMINECISELRKRNVINILGNHDDYLVNGIPESLESKTVKLCIERHAHMIEPDNFNWLKDSLELIDTSLFSARHAGWNNIREERFGDFPFQTVKEYNQNLFLSGHTHIQTIKKVKNKVYCNPGSIGQPRDGDPRAAYAILDGDFQIFRVNYDIDMICNDMREKNFGEWIYKGLYEGKGI